MEEKNFKVVDFFKNKTIMLTGATGFVGKVILEKILFSLSDVKVIVLIRGKVYILPHNLTNRKAAV